MYRSRKVGLQPTARQARALDQLLRTQCELYNAALEERRGAWRHDQRAVTRAEQFGQLKDLHLARPDLMRFGIRPARGTLIRLDEAFVAFFRRCKAGGRPGYPRFKSANRWDSVQWPDAGSWRIRDNRL